MIKMISYRCLLAAAILFPITNAYSADTTVVSHATYAQGWETFIMGDTTATGEHNAHVYMLESSKVYYQLVPLRVSSSMELTGASYDESAGGFPATIQQIPGADGSNQFDNWPASNVLTYGNAQTYKLSNLLLTALWLMEVVLHLVLWQPMVKIIVSLSIKLHLFITLLLPILTLVKEKHGQSLIVKPFNILAMQQECILVVFGGELAHGWVHYALCT